MTRSLTVLVCTVGLAACPGRAPIVARPVDVSVLVRGDCGFETGTVGATPYIAFGSGGLAGTPESGTTRRLTWVGGDAIPLGAELPLTPQGMLPGTVHLFGHWPGSAWLFLRRVSGTGHQAVNNEERRIYFRAGDRWQDLGVDVTPNPGILAASSDTLAIFDLDVLTLYKKAGVHAQLPYPNADCPEATTPRPLTARGHKDTLAIIIACASHPGSKFVRPGDALRVVVLAPDLTTHVVPLPSATSVFLLSDGVSLAVLPSDAGSALAFVTSDWKLQAGALKTPRVLRSAALVGGTLFAITDERQLIEGRGAAMRELRLPQGFTPETIDDAALITGRTADGERAVVSSKHGGKPRMCRRAANGAVTLE